MGTTAKVKPCGCKGKRTCLVCENLLEKVPRNVHDEIKNLTSYVYCVPCQKIFKGWSPFENCTEHESLEGKSFPDIFIQPNFLTNESADQLVQAVDKNLGWDASQSGRRKKNYGPKVNFKKKKLCLGEFQGFPHETIAVRAQLKNVPLLSDFLTIEECFLEYDETRGSHIEPHIDDCWIWGERIVTVNCLGNSILTLTKHNPLYEQQYNIDQIDEYKNELIGQLNDSIPDGIAIRLPMPEKSLFIMYGAPRYQYEHSVLREDITSRRICIAYREFTKPYFSSKYVSAEPIFKLLNIA